MFEDGKISFSGISGFLENNSKKVSTSSIAGWSAPYKMPNEVLVDDFGQAVPVGLLAPEGSTTKTYRFSEFRGIVKSELPVITSDSVINIKTNVNEFNFTYQIIASNMEGDVNAPFFFSASGFPSGLTLNSSTGLLSGTINLSNLGYSSGDNITLTFNVIANNYAGPTVKEITLNITFNGPPVITVSGDLFVELDNGIEYIDSGASALDSIDGDLTDQIITDNTVNTGVPGLYSVTYTVSDSDGMESTAVRGVRIKNTAPTITLSGESSVSLDYGASYIDSGASAFDIADGDITSRIIVDNPVNTLLSNTYNITYNVTDFAGVAAPEVTRTVTVGGNTKPVISLIGQNQLTINMGTEYIDDGATAIDAEEGDLTSSIVTVNPVNTGVAGNYYVSYNVQDSVGEFADEVTRLVRVKNDPPVITISGAKNVSIPMKQTYTESGASALDPEDGELPVTQEGSVDTDIPGTYFISYLATDRGNLTASDTRTVVITNTAPTITVNPAAEDVNFASTYGSAQIMAGVSAADAEEGDLTSAITVQGSINTNVAGIQVVRYSVKDSAGLEAFGARTVNVINTAPVLTVTPIAENVFVGGTYGSTEIDAGVSAADDEEGDLTSSITTVGTVNTSTLGKYTITYNITDGGGLTDTATRDVSVICPTITLTATPASSFITTYGEWRDWDTDLDTTLSADGGYTYSATSPQYIEVEATYYKPPTYKSTKRSGTFSRVIGASQSGSIVYSVHDWGHTTSYARWDYDLEAETIVKNTFSGSTGNKSSANPQATELKRVRMVYLNVKEVTLTSSGGIGTMQYSANGGAYQTSNKFNLPIGSHTATAKDSNGCEATTSFTTEVGAISVSVQVDAHVLCKGDSTGSASGSASGGSGVFTYQWKDSSNNVVAEVSSVSNSLPAGTYKLFVTDSSSVTAESAEIEITEPAEELTITSIDIT